MTKERTTGYTRTNSLAGLAPLVLFLSSYMPLFLLIAVRQICNNSEYLHWSGLSVNAIFTFVQYFGMASICIFLSVAGLGGTWLVFDNLEKRVKNGHTYKLIEVSGMNDEPLAYVATYLIPLVFGNFSNLTDCVTVVIIFCVVYRLYARSKLILVNPILGLKYSIYSIKYKDGETIRQAILISRDSAIIEDDLVKLYHVGYQLFFGYKREES